MDTHVADVDFVDGVRRPVRLLGLGMGVSQSGTHFLFEIAHRTQRHRILLPWPLKPDQVALVLGRQRENRQLASELSGWQIEVEEL
jgi:hypothetical protein